jgi:hypothetical protein
MIRVERSNPKQEKEYCAQNTQNESEQDIDSVNCIWSLPEQQRGSYMREVVLVNEVQGSKDRE